MPKLSWILDVHIVNGPRITVSQTLEVEGAAQVEVTVPKGGAAKRVTVPIGGGATFLLVRTANDKYPSAATDLTFSRPGGGTVFNLDGPQLLTGSNALQLLGGPPVELEFKNKTLEDVAVEMTVGGDSTP